MPKIPPAPFNQGYLAVGDGHSLHFAEYGSPLAPAAVVLHGGPGSGCKPSMLEWFDLSRQRVVLFDQRGAGKSRPGGETRANRTADLVRDIERLRRHLAIPRWLVVGGSWGATLGICYAGQHPEAVSGLVLRGVFLASDREMTWFFQSLKALVPAGWHQLTAGWTASEKTRVLQTLTRMVHSVAGQEQWDGVRRWAGYEDAVMQAMTGMPAPVMAMSDELLAKYRIQSHYLSQSCFTSERSLFRHARRARRLPVILLHGTRDWICPPENARRLARFLPQAELRWIPGGTHTPSDPAIAAALRCAIHDMQSLAEPRHDPLRHAALNGTAG